MTTNKVVKISAETEKTVIQPDLLRHTVKQIREEYEQTSITDELCAILALVDEKVLNSENSSVLANCLKALFTKNKERLYIMEAIKDLTNDLVVTAIDGLQYSLQEKGVFFDDHNFVDSAVTNARKMKLRDKNACEFMKDILSR